MLQLFVVPWILIVCSVHAESAYEEQYSVYRTQRYPCEQPKLVPDPMYYPYTGFIQGLCSPRSLVAGNCKHECDRKCKPNDHRTCYYTLNVEQKESENPIDCAKPGSPGCLKIDGERLEMYVFNSIFPGPMMAVCTGDIVVVDVVNLLTNMTIASVSQEKVTNSIYQNMYDLEVNIDNDVVPGLAETIVNRHSDGVYGSSEFLPGELTSVHFHGAMQRKTPEADGVPFITQYPIPPGSAFRHRFTMRNSGVFFYHSHSGMQRGMGMAGPMLVRSHDDPYNKIIDIDSSKNYIMVTDHQNGNLIINSHGCLRKPNAPTTGYITVFDVEPNKRILFSWIFNLITFFKCECFVEGHQLQLIGLDGDRTQLETVNSIVLGNAERAATIITTNQTIGNYIISCRSTRNATMRQVAILHYKGAEAPPDCSQVDFDKKPPAGIQYSTENTYPGTPGKISLPEIKGAKRIDSLCRATKAIQYHFELAVNSKGFQMNNITFELPKVPLMKQMIETGSLDEKNFCNAESLKKQNIDCSTTTCSCTHVVKFPYNDCVELLMTGFNHPYHTHGFDFYVVAFARDPDNGTLTIDKFLEMDRNGEIQRNLYDPPAKDVVSMPSTGVAVIRIPTRNKGPWLTHCHVEAHNVFGMAAILDIGPKLNYVVDRVTDHFYTPRQNNYCAQYSEYE